MGPVFDSWSGNQILNAAIKTLCSQISWLIWEKKKDQEGIKEANLKKERTMDKSSFIW